MYVLYIVFYNFILTFRKTFSGWLCPVPTNENTCSVCIARATACPYTSAVLDYGVASLT